MTDTDTIKKTLEYVMNTKGNAIVETFYMDFSPIGEKIWNTLVEMNYVYEDEYGLIFLTPIGYEYLDMKVIYYTRKYTMTITNCPYGCTPKVGSVRCSECRYFVEHNIEKNYVICSIEKEKDELHRKIMSDCTYRFYGDKSPSGNNSIGYVSGTSGWGGTESSSNIYYDVYGDTTFKREYEGIWLDEYNRIKGEIK